MPSTVTALVWIVSGAIWLVALIVYADELRFLDRWVGPVWRLVYKWTGAQALDRRLARRAARRDVAMFTDLAARLDSAGLTASADKCRDAAGRPGERIGARR